MSPNEENVTQFPLCVNKTHSETHRVSPENQGLLNKSQQLLRSCGQTAWLSRLRKLYPSSKKLLDRAALPEAG